MTTYYVSDSLGVDTLSGGQGLSSSLPWKTLGYANSNVSSGDTVLLRVGDTWNDQYMYLTVPITIDTYNGAGRPVLDYDGTDGGTYHAVITTTDTASINSLEIRNNLSGNDQVDGGRGIAISGDNTTVDDCLIYNVGAQAILRDFGGDNIAITNCIVELAGQMWSSGNWAGGIAASGDSDCVDGFTVTGCQVSLVHGEAISAFTFNSTTLCTNLNISGNMICGGHAAGVYINGVNGATISKNLITGTSNTSYHRETGSSGYGLGQDNESAFSATNNNIKWYLNYVAYCAPGFYVSDGFGNAITNMYVGQNSFVDCKRSIHCVAGSSFSGTGNLFRHNASVPITGSGGSSHDNGTDVPGASDWTKNQNFWYGGGESSNLNSGDDFSDSAWFTIKTSGWHSISALGDVALNDWRPDTKVEGTQYTNPDTSSNFADAEDVANFKQAGAVWAIASGAVDGLATLTFTATGALAAAGAMSGSASITFLASATISYTSAPAPIEAGTLLPTSNKFDPNILRLGEES